MTQEEIRVALSTKTVGIAGCGGLGSHCAMALARAGVGKLVLADYDLVTENLLSRQYYFADQIGMLKVTALRMNILRANPSTKVVTFDIRLCQSDVVELLGTCDVIVEAFDKSEMKHMILDTFDKYLSDKPLVMGVGTAGFGENQLIRTIKDYQLVVCGDQLNEASPEHPALAPKISAIAGLQANAVIEFLLAAPAM